LNYFNRGREISNEVMGIGIEANNHGIGKELGDSLIASVRVEDRFIDAGQKVLAKAADGFGGAKDGPADTVGVKFDQSAVAFLDFDDAVLNWHGDYCSETGEGVK